MRLQRKFGGPRRQVQNQIEKLRSMKLLHADNVEVLEKFSDALENIVVLLQTQGKLNEPLPNSSLYTTLLEKIPEEMLSQYYRWLEEGHKPETLEVFKDWILDETDYRVKAAEAIKGLKPSKKRFETHLGMVKHADQSKGRAICRLCKTEGHEIWKCEKFKALHTDDRLKIAKDQALCFRCLSNTHRVVVLENVVLTAASQIITICITYFGNHRIPLLLQTTPPHNYLLLRKIQLFLVPQELQPFLRKVSESQLTCPWRGRARFSGLTQQPYQNTLPQNWFL